MRGRYLSGVLLLAGCAGDPDDTTPEGSFPIDAALAVIAAFVDAGSYLLDPWTAETAAPRERNSDVSPHDRVQVWFNDVVIASSEAGNGEFQGTAHDAGSMVVKEMVDEADALLGVAVMLKLEGGVTEWAYYCDGPQELCGVQVPAEPFYGVGTSTDCGGCHGGLVFNLLE